MLIQRNVKTRKKYAQNLYGLRPEEETLNLTAFKRMDSLDYDSSLFAPPHIPFICSWPTDQFKYLELDLSKERMLIK